MIDPDSANLRAKHVYMKAGFKHVCDFMMEGDVSGAGKVHHLLLRKFEPTVSIIQATMGDYPFIQNMARFYVYDLSRDCGSISSDWAIPEDGLYESFDFKNYFEEPSRKAYLVKVYDEIAGFVLLNQATEDATNTWNMGKFLLSLNSKAWALLLVLPKRYGICIPASGKFPLSLIISQP